MAHLAPGDVLRYRGRRATVGALVRTNGSATALTVSHVFGTGSTGRIRLGAGGAPGRLVARTPLTRRGVHVGDAALVALQASAEIRPAHPLVGPLAGHLTGPAAGLEVLMMAPTGVRTGVVVDPAWTGPVRYRWGRRILGRQVLVHVTADTMPSGGDSGALWVTPDGLAVGIQVANLGALAIVTPLGPVLAGWGGRLAR
jgi:hypothetical protein